ncbi:AAA family ATPase [Candidatus Bathyarchaeota archaeon]|nr:AAA family ATPase [Candidatus Bathyarchaeota archaeon]
MLIREVILKNFMSYEYARIPLKEGVNVVCGPNGAGKSSFLLGICVALGDTYTERSKKLSDLIRWGQDTSEVSLILNNSPRGDGQRPVSSFNMDEVRLTRNLRRDGKYWFELNQKTVPKSEVVELLGGFGFDPDNMLIIMHQDMPGQFANLSPQERLKMLEEAVGFNTFRRDVVDAKQKLSGILSEEESLNQLLDRARETLAYWREQNERLQEKRQLQTRMGFLQREMAWSRVMALEKALQGLAQELDDADAELYQAEEEMQRFSKAVVDSEESLAKLRGDYSQLIELRIEQERALGVCEYSISVAKDRLVSLDRMLNSSGQQRRRFELTAKTLKERLRAGPTTLDDYFKLLNEMEKTQSETYDAWDEEFEGQKEETEARLSSLIKQLSEAEKAVSKVTNEMETLRVNVDNVNDRYVEGRIQLALLRDRRGRLKRRIEELKADVDRTNGERRDAEAEALIRGPRVETGRTADDILNEIRKTSGILMGMAEVPGNADEMYDSYGRTYKEIQGKVEQVRESRRQVMIEIEERTRKWSEVIHNLLDEVNARYQSLLSKLKANGEVRLLNSSDIEEAGLEIFVGFNGAQLSKLDPYTHSGGERSTSIMAFLLALQQNVLSPFRAVDEFDLHMDPKNKEIVSEFIVNTMEGTTDQYMAITPSQVTFKGKDIHIVMVHKTEDLSTVRLVEEEKR